MAVTVSRPVRQSTTTARTSLADVIRGGRGLPSRVVLHGQGGIGKTSFAAYAPDPIFLLSFGETGLHTLIDSGQLKDIPNIEIPNWESLIPVIRELTTTEHNYKSLVLDTADGFEKQCNDLLLHREFNSDLSLFGNYSAGNRAVAGGPWRELLIALDALRQAKQMGVILLAHTAIVDFKNPSGLDYKRFVPNMYKDVWQLTYNWADIVLFGYPEVVAKKEKGDQKAKGYGGDVRIMATEYSAIADAKNRHALPAEIQMGNSGSEAWQNFKAALLAGRNGKES